MARRRWLWWLGGVALLALSLFVTAKLLLRSSFATSKVEAKLQELVGGRVEVGQVDVGLNSSSLRDVKFYEQPAAGAPAPDQPWLRAQEVEADASLSSLVEGETPHLITVRDAALTLRFDKDGKLLTQLPKSQGGAGKPAEIPNVKIVGGAVTVRQEGRPDFALTGINLEMTSAGSQLTLNGTIDDPNWGRWQAGGGYDQAADSGSGTLKTAHLPITPAKLRALPVIDPAVWKQFQLEGDVPLSVTVSRRPKDVGVHYRVEADPSGVRVSVPPADLTVTGIAGVLVMDDGVLTLRDLHGQTAGGELRADGVLDLKSTPVKLQFDRVEAKGLDVHKLPAKWNVPKEFGGRLVGQARVTVTIGPDGKVQTTGSG